MIFKSLASVLTLGIAATALIMLAGCTSTPKRPEPNRNPVFSLPVQQVQEAAVSALKSRGYTIQKEDAASVEGTIASSVRIFTTGVDMPPLDTEVVRIALTALGEGSTALSIEAWVTAQADPRYKVTPSRGVLNLDEHVEKILDAIGKLLPKQASGGGEK